VREGGGVAATEQCAQPFLFLMRVAVHCGRRNGGCGPRADEQQDDWISCSRSLNVCHPEKNPSFPLLKAVREVGPQVMSSGMTESPFLCVMRMVDCGGRGGEGGGPADGEQQDDGARPAACQVGLCLL